MPRQIDLNAPNADLTLVPTKQVALGSLDGKGDLIEDGESAEAQRETIDLKLSHTTSGDGDIA